MANGKGEKASMIYTHVNSKIVQIEHGNPANGKAQLAKLRQAAGKELQNVPEIWGQVLEDLPDEFSKGEGPSFAEKAVFMALTNYGLAMQGHDMNDSMHKAGISLGAAAAAFTKKVGEENSHILLRLKRVITADSIDEMNVPLRSMIQLFHQRDVQLDYAKLAQDIWSYNFPNGRDKVRLHWARDYYQNLKPATPAENTHSKTKNEPEKE